MGDGNQPLAPGDDDLVTCTMPQIQSIEPDETAARLLSVIDNATVRDTGSFIAYDGSLIPW